jgi:predicted transcriptional regulator
MHLCIIASMKDTDLKIKLRQTRSAVEALHLRQEDIAKATGLSQSQVSRILNGRRLRRSESTDAVCIYVRNQAQTVGIKDVQSCVPLMTALSKVWDGTAKHAEALSSVIESLGALGSGSFTSSPSLREDHQRRR